MSEMVERVARAIEGEASLTCRDDRCTCAGLERWHCLIGASPEEIARAAIEAMREPTKGMIDAADETGKGGGAGDEGGIEPTVYDLDDVWKAMIDAALSEKS